MAGRRAGVVVLALVVALAAALTWRWRAREAGPAQEREARGSEPAPRPERPGVAREVDDDPLVGQVVDDRGEPVAGATVTARPPGDDGAGEPVVVETNERGRFELPAAVEGGQVTVHAVDHVDGGGSARRGGKPIVMVRTAGLSVHVVDGRGRPVPELIVQVGGLVDEVAGVSDASGRLTVRGLDPRDHMTRRPPHQVGLYGCDSRFCVTGAATLVAGETVEVELVALGVITVSGRVEVVDGAAVRPCPEGGVALLGRSAIRGYWGAKIEPDGSFALEGVLPGTWAVEVSCRGHASAGEPALVVGDRDLSVVYQVTPGGRVDGVVRAEDGSPAVGARVWLVASGAPPDAANHPRKLEARTAVDGTFAITGVAAGTYDVFASLERRRGALAVRGIAIAERERARVELVAPARTGIIEGVVLDFFGQPAADVQLAVTGVGGAWAFGGVTGDDGRFTIRKVEEGTQWVRVLRGKVGLLPLGPGSGGALARDQAQVTLGPRGRASVVLRVGPEATRGAITGVVLDAQGAPVPGLTVSALREPGPEGSSTGLGWYRGGLASEATDDDGRFAIERLDPGRYTLGVYDEELGAARLEAVEVGRDVALRLDGAAAD